MELVTSSNSRKKTICEKKKASGKRLGMFEGLNASHWGWDRRSKGHMARTAQDEAKEADGVSHDHDLFQIVL